MKFFQSSCDKISKINFVDENNVFVGFENSQQCCEDFGWFLSREIPIQIKRDNEQIDADGFNFDIKFFKETGGMVTFQLTKSGQEIFLTLYNIHNGYYSHGFEMNVDNNEIRKGNI